MKKFVIISYLFATTILLMSFNKLPKINLSELTQNKSNDSIVLHQTITPLQNVNFETVQFDSNSTNFSRLEKTIDVLTDDKKEVPVIIKPIDSTQIQMMLDLAYGLGLIFNNGNNFINGVPNTVLHGLGGTLVGLIIMLIRQRKLKKKHKEDLNRFNSINNSNE